MQTFHSSVGPSILSVCPSGRSFLCLSGSELQVLAAVTNGGAAALRHCHTVCFRFSCCRGAKDADTDWPDLSYAQTSRKGGMRWRAGTRRLVNRKMKRTSLLPSSHSSLFIKSRAGIPECETFVIERSLVELSACLPHSNRPIRCQRCPPTEKLSFHLNFLLLL